MNLKNVDALKKNDKFAAIDIGSHNCRLLISEKNQGVIKSVFNSSKPTNLIKNLSYNNEFNYKNIKNTVTIKYKKDAEKTKAICCITNDKLSKFLPQSCEKIVVTNVLFELAKTLKILYPFSFKSSATVVSFGLIPTFEPGL